MVLPQGSANHLRLDEEGVSLAMSRGGRSFQTCSDSSNVQKMGIVILTFMLRNIVDLLETNALKEKTRNKDQSSWRMQVSLCNP